MVIVFIVRMIMHHRKQDSINWKKDAIIILFFGYCFGLASQTIFPDWSAGIDSSTGKPFFYLTNITDSININLIPFKTITEQLVGKVDIEQQYAKTLGIINLAANFFLFVPIGFFVPLVYVKLKHFKNMALTGLSVCLIIELIQLVIGRSFDVDDIILNIFGILTGWMLIKAL